MATVGTNRRNPALNDSGCFFFWEGKEKRRLLCSEGSGGKYVASLNVGSQVGSLKQIDVHIPPAQNNGHIL